MANSYDISTIEESLFYLLNFNDVTFNGNNER